MIIKTLRIGHFGKLHNVELSFGEGLNVVEGVNESGKSTVYAFIIAMLFGLEKSRGRAGRDNAYLKYQPWDTPGAYQGSMDFTHGGHEYRITRVFYQKEKSCVLTDLGTNRQLPLADDTITSLIPELTQTAYMNTFAMGQKALQCSDNFADEVRNYIANLAMGGGSKIDVSQALQRLADRKKTFLKEQKSLNIGELADRRESLIKLEGRVDVLASERREKLNQRSACEEEIAELTELLPDTEFLKIEWQQAEESSEKALDELLDFNSKEPEKPVVKPETEYRSETKADLQRRLIYGLVPFVLGILFCTVGNESSKLEILAGIILLVVGVVVLMSALIMQRESRRKELPAHGLRSEEGQDEESGEISSDNQNASDTDNENANNLAFSEGANEDENEHFSEDEITEQTLLLVCKKAQEEVALAHKRYNEGVEARGELLENIRSLRENIAKLEAEISRIDWELESFGDVGAELDTCSHELKEQREREAALQTEIKALEMAMSAVGVLSEELQDGFSQDFNEMLSEEICLATDGKYSKGRVNDSFGIEVMDKLDFVSAESLSTGTLEQLRIALRFAAGRLLLGDIQAPVLLDESFAYSDNDRLRSALSAIADRDGQQTIIFSFSDREIKLLAEMGVEYSLIKL